MRRDLVQRRRPVLGLFAIVLDGEIVSSPIINFVDNPDGIDGRTGAQISGNFTLQEAQDLAEVLQIGALPIKLALISQSTVSATLGQQALDQGLKAGSVGLVLVLLFLILYYRLLGLIAALGLLVYALFFFALIKLAPDHADAAGDRRPGPDDRRRGRREHRHLRANKGGGHAPGRSMLSAISEGYRKGIATIIDANVITLLTAFILFGLATAGVKGFAFTLGIGTIVSLFTAVLFTQAFLGLLGRSKLLRSPAALGASGEGRQLELRLHRRESKWFFSISGRDPRDRRDLVRDQAAQPRHRLRVRHADQGGARRSRRPSTRSARRSTDADIDGADGGEDPGDREPGLRRQRDPDLRRRSRRTRSTRSQEALDEQFGLESGDAASTRRSVGPTFGAAGRQQAR